MSTKKMQIIGLKGKSAYQYARDGGYTGTEAEFKNKMAKELDAVYDYSDLNEKILATAIKPEVSGEFIHITDSAALPIMDFGMEGKTEQPQYEGNQLFDVNLIKYYTSSGITASIDGTILTLNGTNTSTAYIEFDLPKVIPMGTQVSFTLDNVTANSNVAIRLQSSGVSDGNTYFALDKTNKKITVTTSKNCDSLMILVNPTTINMLFSIMLSKNGNAELEPYTGAQPSPNPDYPQEIVNAGVYNEETGRYEIGCRVGNKNLWDVEYASDINNWIKPSYYNTIPIFVGKGNTVTISYQQQLSGGLGIYFGISKDGYNTNMYDFMYHDSIISYIKNNYTIVAENDYIYPCYFEPKKHDLFMQYIGNDLQIEISSSASEVIPHQSQQFTLTSPEPLTKWDKLVKRDGVWGWSVWSSMLNIDGSTFKSWTAGQDNQLRVFSQYGVSGLSLRNEAFCEKFRFVANPQTLSPQEEAIDWNGTTLQFYLNESRGITDVSTFNTYLNENPISIRYQSTSEVAFHPLPDEEQTLLKQLETYYQVTNIFNDQNCPMSIQYIADTQTYIDNLTTSLTNAVVSLGGEV